MKSKWKVLFGGVLLGGILAWAGAALEENIIKAQRIEIVNAAGETVITLGTNSDGRAQIQLPGVAILTQENGSGAISIMNTEGSAPLVSITGLSKDKGGLITVWNKDGAAVVAQSVDDDGQGAVLVRNKDGNAAAGMRVLANGRGALFGVPLEAVPKQKSQSAPTSASGATEVSPGKYVVGKDSGVPRPGRYRVTAQQRGIISVEDAAGKLKTTQYMVPRGSDSKSGITSYILNLETGDTIETGTTLIFTPTN